MFYNSPLTGGVPWLVLDVQVFMARNGKERKKRERGTRRKERFSLSLSLPPPPPPLTLVFSLCASHDLNVWNRHASRNWFWDCYRGRAGQLLANFSPSPRERSSVCAQKITRPSFLIFFLAASHFLVDSLLRVTTTA